MELAATMHWPVAFSLSLVSHLAHAWIAPLLYQTVILRTEDQVLSFRHVSRINLALVKSLALDDLHTDILRKCENVSYLVLEDGRGWDSWHDVMQSTCSGAKPREIRMIFTLPVKLCSASCPFFANITHIEFGYNYCDMDEVLTCPWIQQLTHLGIRYPELTWAGDGYLSIQRILDATPALHLLVLYMLTDHRKNLAPIRDERLLVGHFPLLYWHRRGMVSEGFPTVWDFAERNFKEWRDPTHV